MGENDTPDIFSEGSDQVHTQTIEAEPPQAHKQVLDDQRAAHASTNDIGNAIDKLNEEEDRVNLSNRSLAETISECAALTEKSMLEKTYPQMNRLQKLGYKIMELFGMDVYSRCTKFFIGQLTDAERSLDKKIQTYVDKIQGTRKKPGLAPTVAEKERMIRSWAELFTKVDAQKEGLSIEIGRLQEDLQEYKQQIADDPRNEKSQRLYDAASQHIRDAQEDMFNLNTEQKRISSKLRTNEATIQSTKRVMAMYQMARNKGECELNKLRAAKAIVEVYISEREHGTDLATFFVDLANVQDLIEETEEVSVDIEENIASILDGMNQAEARRKQNEIESYGVSGARIDYLANQNSSDDMKDVRSIVSKYTS